MLGLTLLAGSAMRLDAIGSQPARGRISIPFWLIFLAGTLFGALIEWIQAIMPFGRVGDPMDMVANALGALLAVIILRILGHTSIAW